MGKRFTDTEIWDKEWFMGLSIKEKCLVRYLFDKCDAAGVWAPNWRLASAYIGQNVSEKDLQKFAQRIDFLPDGKIFIIDFIEFQYGVLSENCKPHISVIQKLKKYGIYQRVLEGYSKGIETFEDKEKDREKEKEKDQEKEEDSEKIKNPFSEDFPMWQTWIEYKFTEHRDKFKTVKTEQASINHLYELARGQTSLAVEIINQSIANRWKGLFELKNKKDGAHQQIISNNHNSQKPSTGEQRIAGMQRLH